MEVTQTHGPRFDLALERFREGHAFTFDRVGFLLASDGAFELLVPTSWLPENVTEQTASRDFERASQLADSLVDSSPEFAAIVGHRTRRVILLNDYGMGAVELCRFIDGTMVWKRGAPSAANAT